MNIYLGKRHAYAMTVTWRSDDPEPIQDEKISGVHSPSRPHKVTA
jgi:hypothetical protein